jgi:hypothetical protein
MKTNNNQKGNQVQIQQTGDFFKDFKNSNQNRLHKINS